MDTLELIRSHAGSLPLLARFAIGMALIVGIPPLARRARLPVVVVFLLSGIVVGPDGLGIIPKHPYVADFLAELGKLLLMFFAGLEIDLVLFQRARNRSLLFGFFTTLIPQCLGTAVGLWFGYSLIPSIVLGSLLASHTLLGSSIVVRQGLTRFEPIIITFGATVMSDTLSLIVFAVCLSTYQSGFSVSGIAVQLIEIAIFIPLILLGLSRFGAYLLKKVEDDEHAYLVLLLAIVAVAGLLAQSINLPGIVGAFLAGLAVNGAVRDQPVKEKLELFGNSFFIPIFFIVTGFLIDPIVFFHSIVDNFTLVSAIIGALLVGKWLAVEITGRAFGYTTAARWTMWSLTLPQVAATLAATLVAYDTFNPAGQRLIDKEVLNVVLVLMLTTAILGPVLTERFAPRLRKEADALKP